MQNFPATPLAAVTAADPYPYYAALVEQRPLYRDEALRCWVASSAAAVTAILECPAARVRPLQEPVPVAIAGSAAGEVFSRLIRMNDGDFHHHHRPLVEAPLNAAPLAGVAETARAAAETWLAGCSSDALALPDRYQFTVPAHTVASLLGVPPEAWPTVVRQLEDFVRCLSPLSGPEALAAAAQAAEALQAVLTRLLAAPPAESWAAQLRQGGWQDAQALLANTIGLLSQTFEATAGLIGNTLLTLARQPDWAARVAASPQLLPALVAEVARWDAPIQNTRRFLAADATIGDTMLRAGDTVMVVLAAANRDPMLQPDADRFLPDRSAPRLFTFGLGRHACPGARLAVSIAAAAVGVWLDHGRPLPPPEPAGYHPSVNARLPYWSPAAQ